MLHECHGHIMLNGYDFRQAQSLHRNGVDLDSVRANLTALKEAGVTYFRDGGDPFGVSLAAKAAAPDYGVTLRACSFAIHKKGSYGSILGRAWSTGSDQAELIKKAKADGADFIKLIISGLIDFDHFGSVTGRPCTKDEIFSLVNIAHGEGMSVMAHVNGADTVKYAIDAGCDSIEHGCYMDGEGLELLKEKGTVWVPTLAAIDAFVGRDGYEASSAGEIFEAHFKSVKKALAMGCLVAPGSDSGAFGVIHGEGAKRELELLKQAGAEEEMLQKACDVIKSKF